MNTFNALVIPAFILGVLTVLALSQHQNRLRTSTFFNIGVVLISLLSGFVFLNNPISQVSIAREIAFQAPWKLARRERIAYYTLVISWFPDCVEAYNNRGCMRIEQNDHIGAIQDFTSAIAFSKHGWKKRLYLENRAFARVSSQDYTEAIKDFDALIESEPRTTGSEIYFTRGQIRSKLLNFIGATQDFLHAEKVVNNEIEERAKRPLPLSPSGTSYDKHYFFFSRGRILQELGRHQDAIQDFTQASRWYPSDPNSVLGRGLSEFEIGNTSAAVKDFELARKLSPDRNITFSQVRTLFTLEIEPSAYLYR